MLAYPDTNGRFRRVDDAALVGKAQRSQSWTTCARLLYRVVVVELEAGWYRPMAVSGYVEVAECRATRTWLIPQGSRESAERY